MASDPEFLAPLQQTLRDLVAWWDAQEVNGLIIGGLAVALLGRPRVTRDVDGLVWLEEARWPEFLAASAPFQFIPRIADPLTLAREGRILLLRHVPTETEVDVAFAALSFEREALKRASRTKVGGIQVPLPTPEDLIIMKAVAHRPVDLTDIEGLIVAHPKLDRRRIRKYLREFAALLEKPEVFDAVEQLLARRRTGRR